jgi:hypothetical protein
MTRSIMLFLVALFFTGCGGTTLPMDGTDNMDLSLRLLGIATASSSETSHFNPENAIDGRSRTRWSSTYSDPQWIQIDLGSSKAIAYAVLRWEAYSKIYEIQLSDNGITWAKVYGTTTGNGGVDKITINGTARYVRMYSSKRGTTRGNSLWEFEVYKPTCIPSCTGKQCGDNGCGRSCGSCEINTLCDIFGQCIGGCTPNCIGKTCGDNGCGGSCGICLNGTTCNAATNQCVTTCISNCIDKKCGDNGCGGSCGTCNAPETCGGNGTANVCGYIASTQVIDKFGINMFYATKVSGHSWDSQTLFAKAFNTDWDNSHKFDPEIYMTGNGQYTSSGNGELKLSKNSDGGESPRFYIGDGLRTWDGNVEVTFYSNVGLIDKSYTDGSPAWIWGGLEAVVRTSHFPETDACNSRGYGGRMTLDGDCDFEKEQTHPGAAYSNTTPAYPWGTKTDIPINKWLGFKLIARDQGTASNVHLELWLDNTSNGVLANQNWVKIVDYVDTDNKAWASQDSGWCCATHKNKSYRGINQTASKFVYIRADGSNPQYYKWVSVREINPEL